MHKELIIENIKIMYTNSDVYTRKGVREHRTPAKEKMNEYVIFADSACDILPQRLREWGVEYESLSFRFSAENREYLNYDMTASDFYNRMRGGDVAKTSAINTYIFKESFSEILESGKDILYLGFSSGLSTTYNSAREAMKELAPKYGEERMRSLDTLSASAGFGLLLYLTVQKKKEGASMDEAYQYASGLVPRLCHWFTVEDLVYLKRGGRVSAAAAFFGNMLGIKPVLHMDNAGHLVPVSKVRGRRASLAAMADKYIELGENVGDDDIIFISHGDCKEDAELLSQMIYDKCGAKPTLITNVGPVIGAHAGPGVVALFFVGKTR